MDSMKPTTTAEQDLLTASQRRVNLTWEITQAAVALFVTASFSICQALQIPAPVLDTAFFMIATFYFVRTNHQRTGGVQQGGEGR